MCAHRDMLFCMLKAKHRVRLPLADVRLQQQAPQQPFSFENSYSVVFEGAWGVFILINSF